MPCSWSMFPHTAFFLYWSSFVMLSGTMTSNLTNIVNSLFSLLPGKIYDSRNILFEINNNSSNKNPCSWTRGSIKDENNFGSILADSNLPVAALWPPATPVVVVMPHICSSVCSHNLESNFKFPVSFWEMHNSVLQILFH